jgi:hypothetical protein
MDFTISFPSPWHLCHNAAKDITILLLYTLMGLKKHRLSYYRKAVLKNAVRVLPDQPYIHAVVQVEVG